MRQFLLGVVLVVFSVSSAYAADVNGVKAFADKLARSTLVVVKDESLSGIGKQERLEDLFRDAVDIPWVAKFVMGKYWRTASDAQKKAYLKSYEKFVLKNYTSKLTDYSGQEYKILNTRTDDDGEYLLTMELVNDNEPNVLMDYRIRRVGSSYKIFDIVVEGVSMITTQRSEFGSVISSKGLDFLIGALEKKAAKKAS